MLTHQDLSVEMVSESKNFSFLQE